MESIKEEYKVYDEMSCSELLITSDRKEAHSVAYNHQCILIDNITGKVIKDYSCDW